MRDRARVASGARRSVTVLVPAYRPDERLTRTLESLAAQTHRRVRVHVSVDHAPDHVLPPLPDLRKLSVVHQPQRLGWVGNVNALLATVRTPFFCIVAHDDALTAGYLAKAVQALVRSPEAVVAHGAVRHFGVRDGEIARTDDLRGDAAQRVLEFIRRGPHRAELGWRGVIRSSVLERGFRLRARKSDGQFSNTLWALELLLHGESRAFSNQFYDKFTADDGLSRVFHQRSADERSVMLADNVACLADALSSADLTPEQREEITAGYVQWLLSLPRWGIVEGAPDKVTYQDVRPAVSRFVARTLLHHAEPPRPH